MMRTKVVLLSAPVLLVATVAFAGPCGMGFRGPGHGPPLARLERGLQEAGVGPEQMERIRPLLDAAKERRAAHRPQVRAAFEEMRALLEQDRPDEGAVLRQAEKIGALKTEQHKAMLRTLLAVRAELTPEQHQRLKEMRAHDMKRGGGHPRRGPFGWGRRHGRDAPPPAE